MKIAKLLIICFITNSFWLLEISYSQHQDLNWNFIKSKPFIIYYLENDIINANAILKTLESSYPQLSTQIGYQLNSPIGVFLCNSEKTYNYVVGKHFPKWSEGIAIPENKLIIIKANNRGSDPRKTAIHELTHILLNGAVNNRPIPRWFNEGLAIFYSNEKEFASSSLVSKALLTNSIISLNDIDKVLTFNQSKAQLAYQESYLAVNFLIEKFGVNHIKKVVQALSLEQDADQAFLNAIGMDLWDFELEWLKYIKHKHRWHFLVDFDIYLWILILLLFIIGFIIIRRRNRQTLKRWEREEEPDEPC